MSLSKKTRRNLAQFNRIKYSPTHIRYSLSQPTSQLDMAVKAAKELIYESKQAGEVVTIPVPREDGSNSREV